MKNDMASRESLAKELMKYTGLKEEEALLMVETAPLIEPVKGSILLHQGDFPNHSYYVIAGCIRQYTSDASGKEVSVNFFVENEPINMFSFIDDEGNSLYSLQCLEDCILVECDDVGGDDEEDTLEMLNLKRQLFEKQFIDIQKNNTNLKLKTHEERFEHFYQTRPDLLDRVPQMYLASYLGMTPETFSRYKKRRTE